MNGRSRNSARSISGLRWRAQWSANSASSDDAASASAVSVRASAPPPGAAFDEPERERADAACDQQRAERVGRTAPGGPGRAAAAASRR